MSELPELPKLSPEERLRRLGIPPLERLVAVQEDTGYDIGHSAVGDLISATPVGSDKGDKS